MAWTLDELMDKRVTVHHPGSAVGVTYFVDGVAYCLEPTSPQDETPQQYCSQRAGYGTDHAGTGNCKYHWGNLPPRMIKYQKFLKGELRQRYNEISQLDDLALMDLRPELRLLRTLLTSTVQAYQQTQSARAMDLTLRILDNISNTIDRIDKIQSRQTLTASTAKMMFWRAVQVAKQFIPIESIPAFLALWRTEVGSYLTNPVQDNIKQIVEGDIVYAETKDAD